MDIKVPVNKYLFLDFDGVLHGTTSSKEDLFSRAYLLEEFMKQFPCQIIISSSWRFHYELDYIRGLLPPTLGKLVKSKTGDPVTGRWPRYNEILSYLQNESGHADWRALDDAHLEFPPECPEFIRCDPKRGLTLVEIQSLKEWLMI